MIEFGRVLVILGVVLLLIGGLILVAGRFFPWLGNLPGDLSFEGENFKLYIPPGHHDPHQHPGHNLAQYPHSHLSAIAERTTWPHIAVVGP
ncbi:MAG: DUF2905 domain-containing protein [Chloroflexi bacterium]|nr:DUF2905 domain-containing protein [Chloroflexota bacterium]